MLILGGTGFIGRHLCTALSARGRRAVVVSRTPDYGFLKTYAPGITGVDLPRMLNDADDYFRAAETLVYLATTSVPATYTNQPWNELTANVHPAFELFDRGLKANPRLRVIFISSGGTIYGPDHTAPIPETAPLAPISAYGYGKLATEEAIRFLGRTQGLSHAILRVSNPVGHWQANRTHGIVTVALRAANSGETLNLFGGGYQIRDFIDADDLAEAIIRAADARTFTGETWNIGSGVGHSVTEVVDLVSELTGLCVRRTSLPKRPVDVSYAVLDCTKAQRDLGWSAKIELRETIRAIERVWNETQSHSSSSML